MFGKRTNISHILHYVSIVLVFESLFMFAALVVAVIYHETTFHGILYSALITLTTGLLLNAATRKYRGMEPRRRESLLIASLSWFILGLFGTLPYIFTHSIPGFVNALFESISGFSTTGSSILVDIEVLPKSILFWRSVTHWIGGMGIIVLVIAIMPFLKINGMQLFSSEASVVVDEKFTARMRHVARNIWLIYIGLTISEILTLTLFGMPLFDSVCHSFGTIATGGFSTQNDSIAGYSPAIQYTIMVFMMLSGMNFSLHFFAITGHPSRMFKNEEWRSYVGIILATGAIITVILWHKMGFPIETAFRNAYFQVVSIITATGFATDDYLLWPAYANMFIVMLMLIGASAGSTGGGVKVIRFVFAFKKIRHNFKVLIHPKSVHPIKYGGQVIDSSQISGIIGYIILYYLIIGVGTLVLMAMGIDRVTSFSAVATTMEGCGPGFGTVGPVSNFFHLPDAAKIFLCGTMIAGRLEIYPVLILFTRWFWKS